MHELLNKSLLNFFLQNEIDLQCSHFVLGVSGGADSMTLLHWMMRHAGQVTVAHVNYGFREEESEAETQLVQRFCENNGIDFLIHKANKKSHRGNKQDWARKVRYSFFHTVLNKRSANFIVTAHHKADQIETIFLNILRGLGPESLAGIKARQELFLRPMLNVEKQYINDYVLHYAIPYAIDSSNLSSDFNRNFLRNELFPLLKQRFPGFGNSLFHLSELGTFIQDHGKQLTTFVYGKRELPISVLRTCSPFEKTILIRRWIQSHQHDLILKRRQIQALLELCEQQKGSSITLSSSISVIREQDELLIYSIEKEIAKSFLRVDAKSTFPITIGFVKLNKITIPPSFKKQNTLYIRIPSQYFWVRDWQDADRIQPLGMQGHKLVSDVLTDAGIRSVDRKCALVIESFESEVLSVIFPPANKNYQRGIISEKAKLFPKDSHCLSIEINEHSSS